MSLKDIVQDRLNRMEDLEQRRELKNIVSGLFTNLANYQEEMKVKLEERIFSEIDTSEEMLNIYVTICPREDIDPIHDYLFPMVEEDLVAPVFDTKSAITALSGKRDVFLYTLFLACDFPMLQKLISRKPSFHGKMMTNKGVYNIEVELQQNRKYVDEIEKLYVSFIKNDLSCRTVHHPYANKFFDVYLTSIDGELQEDEVVLEISAHFQEWEPYKRTNVIPIWNIQRLDVPTTGFPYPALDRINYEHTLSLHKYGIENGFLIDGTETNIMYTKRLQDSLVVVSPEEESKKWKVLKIAQPKETSEGNYPYKLVSNKRKETFINRYASLQSRTIRTKGELFRLVDSFEAATRIELVDMKILDRGEKESFTYDMNPFVIENIRVNQHKKVLQMAFKTDEEGDYLIYDLISFLVSEVQRVFPEYRCEGVFI